MTIDFRQKTKRNLNNSTQKRGTRSKRRISRLGICHKLLRKPGQNLNKDGIYQWNLYNVCFIGRYSLLLRIVLFNSNDASANFSGHQLKFGLDDSSTLTVYKNGQRFSTESCHSLYNYSPNGGSSFLLLRILIPINVRRWKIREHHLPKEISL